MGVKRCGGCVTWTKRIECVVGIKIEGKKMSEGPGGVLCWSTISRQGGKRGIAEKTRLKNAPTVRGPGGEGHEC